MIEVGVHSHPALSLDSPHKLFTLSGDLMGDSGYDIATAMQRFLFARRADSWQTASLTVVKNWFAEFKDRQK
jgi:hypothetical protein